MSDLPNWIKSIDSSSLATEDELIEIEKLTQELKDAIKECNIKKIKALEEKNINYFNQRGFFTLANLQIEEIHDFTEKMFK